MNQVMYGVLEIEHCYTYRSRQWRYFLKGPIYNAKDSWSVSGVVCKAARGRPLIVFFKACIYLGLQSYNIMLLLLFHLIKIIFAMENY